MEAESGADLPDGVVDAAIVPNATGGVGRSVRSLDNSRRETRRRHYPLYVGLLVAVFGFPLPAASQGDVKEPTRRFPICDLVRPFDQPLGRQAKVPDWWTPLYPDELYAELAEQCWQLLGPEMINDNPVIEVVRAWQAMNSKEFEAFRTAQAKYDPAN